MFKLVLEKAEESETKLPTSAGSSKKQEFQKNIYFCFIDYAKAFDYVDHNKLWKILKAFDCVDHNKVWKILKEMGIPDHLPASSEICIQVKNQQLELDMKQQTGSRLGKEYIKAAYCHLAYLTYMQSTSCETSD